MIITAPCLISISIVCICPSSSTETQALSEVDRLDHRFNFASHEDDDFDLTHRDQHILH